MAKNYRASTGVDEFFYGILNETDVAPFIAGTPERVEFLQSITIEIPQEAVRANERQPDRRDRSLSRKYFGDWGLSSGSKRRAEQRLLAWTQQQDSQLTARQTLLHM